MTVLTQQKVDENRTKWLGALRSGEYKQTRRRLRRYLLESEEYVHCCLGVLCDVIAPRAWNPLEIHDGVSGVMPSARIKEAVGLSNGEADGLALFNDTHHWDFLRIADWLEDLWWGHLDHQQPQDDADFDLEEAA